VFDEKEGLPETGWYPGGEGARHQEAASDVHPHRRPVHHEIVADRGEALLGGYPLPKRATFVDGHIHGGMPFHSPCHALLSLLLGLVEQISLEKYTKQNDQ
jgi:hypothetical protein